MNTFTIPATKLKEKVSDVLDVVYFKKETAIIERYGKPIAKIVPWKEDGKESMADFLKRTFGSIPDLPDVRKFRNNRRNGVVL